MARQWNVACEVDLIAVYVFANIWVFGPPCMRQWRGVSQLTSANGLGARDLLPEEEAQAARATVAACDDVDRPPTVTPGCDYWRIEDVYKYE